MSIQINTSKMQFYSEHSMQQQQASPSSNGMHQSNGMPPGHSSNGSQQGSGAQTEYTEQQCQMHYDHCSGLKDSHPTGYADCMQKYKMNCSQYQPSNGSQSQSNSNSNSNSTQAAEGMQQSSHGSPFDHSSYQSGFQFQGDMPHGSNVHGY